MEWLWCIWTKLFQSFTTRSQPLRFDANNVSQDLPFPIQPQRDSRSSRRRTGLSNLILPDPLAAPFLQLFIQSVHTRSTDLCSII